MSADPNKKNARTFQCREVLWEAFEQMARELECSVDYLVNEAMKQYARQRSHGVARTPYPAQRIDPASQGAALPQASAAPAGAPPPALGRAPAPAPLPPPPGGRVLPPPGRPLPSMPLPPPHRPSAVPVPPPAVARAPSGMPPLPPMSATPPPVPGASRAPAPTGALRSMPPLPSSPGAASRAAADGGSNGQVAPAAQTATLTLIYNGERFAVTKDKFAIGRGKQSSDLTLKDPNVSRQHALVEFQNGVYFMVDMGSTNGVTFNGQRITRRPIAEGDVFRICDHDLRFTYH